MSVATASVGGGGGVPNSYDATVDLPMLGCAVFSLRCIGNRDCVESHIQAHYIITPWKRTLCDSVKAMNHMVSAPSRREREGNIFQNVKK